MDVKRGIETMQYISSKLISKWNISKERESLTGGMGGLKWMKIIWHRDDGSVMGKLSTEYLVMDKVWQPTS